MAWTTSDIRFGLDGVSSISWLESCNVSTTGLNKNQKVVISAFCSSSDHTPGTTSLYLQWRNQTDNPTGTFATFQSDTGELRAAASAGVLTNGSTISNSAGCQTSSYSEEIENESPLLSQSFSPAKSEYIETQWCIDFSNALDNKVYEFELYSSTLGSLGISTATITTAAGAASYDVGPNNTTHSHIAGTSSTTVDWGTISPNDATHAHSAGQASAEKAPYDIAVDSTTHAHTVTQSSINSIGRTVAPNATTHAHTVEQVSINSIGRTISPDTTIHTHTSGQAGAEVITGAYDVSPDATTHANTAEESGAYIYTGSWDIAPDNATHAHTAEEVNIPSAYIIVGGINAAKIGGISYSAIGGI